MRPKLALTTGEPAGIGPEIAVAALTGALAADVTLIGDAALIDERARRSGHRLPDDVRIEHVALAAPSRPGSARRGATRATCWRPSIVAIDGCQAGRYDAIVTAPVQKSVINDAGIAVHRPHRIPAPSAPARARS